MAAKKEDNMENYFMDYNKDTGDIKGFYLKSIHGVNIPEGCIEITPEKHDFYMDNNGLYRLNLTTLIDELIPIVILPVVKTEVQINTERIDAMETTLMGLMFPM